MKTEDSGKFVRHVETPMGGGYKVVQSKKSGENLIEVSYFDRYGVEHKERHLVKGESFWRRLLDGFLAILKWIARRL